MASHPSLQIDEPLHGLMHWACAFFALVAQSAAASVQLFGTAQPFEEVVVLGLEIVDVVEELVEPPPPSARYPTSGKVQLHHATSAIAAAKREAARRLRRPPRRRARRRPAWASR